MPRIGVSLTVFVLSTFILTSALRAQTTPPQPPQTPPATEADKKLDGFLGQWEKKMQEITSLYAKLERSEKDKTFKTEEKFTGKAEYMKVGSGATVLNLALLEMNVVGK